MDVKTLKKLNYITLINDMGAFVVAPIMGVYLVNALGFSVAKVGIITSASFAANLIGSMLGNYLWKKINTKRLIYLSLLLQAIGLLLFPFTKKLPILCGLYAMFGLGYCVGNLSIQTIISSYSPKENLTELFAKRGMLSNVGISIGVLAGGALGQITRYTIAFYIAGALFLLCILCFMNFSRKNSLQDKSIRVKENIRIGNTLKNRGYLLFNIVLLGFWSGYSWFSLNIPIFISGQFPKVNIGYVYCINTLVIVLLQVYLTRLFTKKISYLHIIQIGCIVMAIAFLIFWISGEIASISVLLIGIVIFTVSEILTAPIIPTYVSSITPEGEASNYMTILSIFKYIGLSLGNLGGGILTDKVKEMNFDSHQIWMLYFVLMTFFCFLLMGYVLQNKSQIAKGEVQI
ncbi:MAG: hypothetical protein K0S61_1058 [Anaerocolumna sp.]|jgi:MFS family permease|nr:hypothetical protein [Anaerocolumna sp.]